MFSYIKNVYRWHPLHTIQWMRVSTININPLLNIICIQESTIHNMHKSVNCINILLAGHYTTSGLLFGWWCLEGHWTLRKVCFLNCNKPTPTSTWSLWTWTGCSRVCQHTNCSPRASGWSPVSESWLPCKVLISAFDIYKLLWKWLWLNCYIHCYIHWMYYGLPGFNTWHGL